MADKVAFDSGFFATVKSQHEWAKTVDFTHVRALLLEPSAERAAQLGHFIRESRVGVVAHVADAAAAPTALEAPGPGIDIGVIDLRRGGAGAAAAEALRAQVKAPFLLLVDALGPDVMDLAFKLRPATIVPQPLDPVAFNRYVGQIAKRPA